MKRVLLISDSHGQVDERILELARKVDVVVHGGDVGGPAVLQLLRDHCPELRAVRGNNDVPERWPAHGLAGLKALPDVEECRLPGGLLVVEHGHRAGAPAVRHERLRVRHSAARAILYGHSHRLLVDDGANPWVLNPGACGRSRTYGGPSCLLLRAGERVWRLEERRFPLLPRRR